MDPQLLDLLKTGGTLIVSAAVAVGGIRASLQSIASSLTRVESRLDDHIDFHLKEKDHA